MEKKNNNLKKNNHLYSYSKAWNLLYRYVCLFLRLFYKTIVIEGKDNIPNNSPIIFAPNHQNALMDPLAVLYGSKRQIVFLARADIFLFKNHSHF